MVHALVLAKQYNHPADQIQARYLCLPSLSKFLHEFVCFQERDLVFLNAFWIQYTSFYGYKGAIGCYSVLLSRVVLLLEGALTGDAGFLCHDLCCIWNLESMFGIARGLRRRCGQCHWRYPVAMSGRRHNACAALPAEGERPAKITRRVTNVSTESTNEHVCQPWAVFSSFGASRCLRSFCRAGRSSCFWRRSREKCSSSLTLWEIVGLWLPWLLVDSVAFKSC